MIDCRFINVSLTTISGNKYPPKNNIIVKVDINTIEQYSPRKKKTNITPIYLGIRQQAAYDP
jgi:hypothetical protein